MGFRSVAWEEDWTTGLRIDHYLQTDNADLDALMRQMSPQWQSRQVAQVLAWLRDDNAGHADRVRFVGVEYYLLGSLAHDAVDRHTRRVYRDAHAARNLRRWLEAPIRTRGLPDRGLNSSMSGGTLAQWFDVIVHRQELTPTQPA